MSTPLTARMRSPTFKRPQRSAGLPSMIRPRKHQLASAVSFTGPSMNHNICHLKHIMDVKTVKYGVFNTQFGEL